MLVIKYALFAAIATLLNLTVQATSLAVYQGASALVVAMLFGTITGLFAKYILDKIYIFQYVSKGKKDDAAKFLMYSVIGIGTTLIFWVCEIMLDRLWDNPVAKYVGAVVGLSIGYLIKYHMDKRFVFAVSEVTVGNNVLSR